MNRGITKTKTSITLSVSLLVQIDKLIGERASRSAFIEKVLQDHLRDEARRTIQERDLQILNENADYLSSASAARRSEEVPVVCHRKPSI